MNRHIDNNSIKLAWQAAFEARTCPDSATLYSAKPDKNLKQHLEFCQICREKLAMLDQERAAWRTLGEKFAASTLKPARGLEKQTGQIWTIKKEAGGWQGNGRFARPPSVLLLEKAPGQGAWKAAQLHWDNRLMGSGDISLEEPFGFAEAWNCYTLKEDRLDCCLGAVKEDTCRKALEASLLNHEPAREGSVLSFFRMTEVEVGAYVAVPAVLELVEEWEAQAEDCSSVNWMLEKIFGSIKDVINNAEHLIIPERYSSLLELLSGARNPDEQIVLTASDCNISLPVNIVRKICETELSIKTISASITDDDWLDGNYLVAGKLCEEPPAGLHLLASLIFEEGQVAECVNQITIYSPYFDIIFKNVPKEVCSLENVRFLLVSP